MAKIKRKRQWEEIKEIMGDHTGTKLEVVKRSYPPIMANADSREGTKAIHRRPLWHYLKRAGLKR